MSTLAEIESAAEALPPEQREELFLFLATRLRAGSADMPPAREFNREKLNQWIREDEEGYRKVLGNR